MAPEPLPLDRLQRWFQAVVVHPSDEGDEAVAAPAAAALVPADAVGDVILPSRTLSPVERVGIYHGMYILRMHEALQADFPCLEHFVGGTAFWQLVRDYVEAFPSKSFSLNPLGDHLPEFVKSAPGIKRPEFCHELATLELAISHVFDEVETPPLSETQIAAVPADAWGDARLVPIQPFRLLAFRYPVNAYVQTVRDDNHDHPKPRLKNEWLVLYRRDYGVYRHVLTQPAYELLRDLAAGTPLGAAVAAAIKRGGRRPPTEAELFRWFREWVQGGVFQKVELAA